jgi:hypothetical protein
LADCPPEAALPPLPLLPALPLLPPLCTPDPPLPVVPPFPWDEDGLLAHDAAPRTATARTIQMEVWF